jgi:uncharacterized FAD-dependent dehydrogenase
MTYKILAISQIDDAIITSVQLGLDSDLITLDITHFRPNSLEEINNNIINRAISEQSKIDAKTACADIAITIPIGILVTF